jgi:hypothetical protein
VLTVLAVLDLRPPTRRDGSTVVALDTSASVDRTEARALLGTALGALGRDGPVRLVEGDDAVRAVDPAAPLTGPGDGTLAGPLLQAAATLAGPDGAILYVGDGHAPDLPLALPVPVFALPVAPRGVDVAVTAARALRIGELAYVHATFVADADTTAEVEIDRVTTELALEAGRPRILTARVRPGAAGEVLVRAQVAGDPRPENDTARVPVPPEDARTIAVIAGGAAASHPVAWARAAGLAVRSFTPEAVGTDDRTLWEAGGLWIHDVPGRATSPRSRPPR